MGLLRLDERLLSWLTAVMALLFLGGIVFAFVAIGIHLRRARDQRAARVREDRWTELLHAVLAGDAPSASLWSAVAASEQPHFAHFLVLYAARLRGTELETVRALAPDALAALVARYDRSAPARRAADIRAIALLGLPAYEALVLRALDDPSGLVAATAAQALCRPEYAAYAPAVLETLQRFTPWSPRFVGLLLARFGPDAAPALRAQLADDRPVRARVAAAHALYRMGDVAAADRAAEIASLAADPALTVACLRILERVGSTDHAAPVRRLLSHPSGDVRSAAVGALAAIGDDHDQQRFSALLSDTSPWVALRSALALARLNRTLLQRAAADAGTPVAAAVAREALALQRA